MLAPIRNDPALIQHVVVNGHDLSLSDVMAVARFGAKVSIAPEASARIRKSRERVEELVQSGEKIYGLNTGFGSLRDVLISPSEVRLLQTNLIRSHAAGVGEPLPEDVVRAMMLLRLNTLSAGYSGIRHSTLERIVTLLNARVYPWIPSRGSVGASGDLAPLAHLALVITGDPAGKIYIRESDPVSNHRGDFIETPRATSFVPLEPGLLQRSCGLGPYDLDAKEGLALTNGTQLMTALGALSLYDAFVSLEAALVAAAASIEAIKGSVQAFDERLSELRGFQEQSEIASSIKGMLRGSSILASACNIPYLKRISQRIEAILHEDIPLSVRQALTMVIQECERALGKARFGDHPRLETRLIFRLVSEAIVSLDAEGQDRLRANLVPILTEIEAVAPGSPRVQDDYSFRCIPQVLGSALWVLNTCGERIVAEMNAVTDNPLIFESASGKSSDSPNVLSGGNFHGEPVAMAMDMAAIAISEIASLSERRSAQLLDSSHHYGLPSQLIARSGVNSGFMIAQYTAAALVSECKLLAHPASIDSIPTCENTEDHVSMGPIAGLKLRRLLANLEEVIGIELLLAGQALNMWHPLEPGPGGRLLLDLFAKADIPFVESDLPLYQLMERTVFFIRKEMLHLAIIQADAQGIARTSHRLP